MNEMYHDAGKKLHKLYQKLNSLVEIDKSNHFDSIVPARVLRFRCRYWFVRRT